jgi:hypothetical protein
MAPYITIFSASIVIALIAGFTFLFQLKKLEDQKREEKEILERNTFPCRKCTKMVTPIFLKDDKWGYKCKCSNSWILKI